MWRKLGIDLPPKENAKLECTTSDGSVVELVRRGNLYFSGDMYVYYAPIAEDLINMVKNI
jgi:hypothetical protein